MSNHQARQTVLRVRRRGDGRLDLIERPGGLRQLRRSSWTWVLLDELARMGMSDEQAMARAIASISHSDPLIKLLQQVRLGRMKPTDAGLRAITESWLGSY